MAARLELRMRKALTLGGQLYEAAELAQAAAQRYQREGNIAAAVAVLVECATAQLQHPHVSGAVRRGVECAAAVLHLLNDNPAAPGASGVSLTALSQPHCASPSPHTSPCVTFCFQRRCGRSSWQSSTARRRKPRQWARLRRQAACTLSTPATGASTRTSLPLPTGCNQHAPGLLLTGRQTTRLRYTTLLAASCGESHG